ncbi:nucleotidyltransferase domain-containing protein [Candidatus Dependentiae bacterium]|jgi:predicted nucleotidyltransferase|nr:nucleotidyltransferase domain-containing protein [Candidatus Dependentiae bacterium]
MKNQTVTRFKDELLKIIHKHLPGCQVYLFGSRARASHQEGADMDIALDTGEKIDFRILFKIKDEIEETTIPVFVDIIDLNSVSNSFKNEIKQDMIPWQNLK